MPARQIVQPKSLLDAAHRGLDAASILAGLYVAAMNTLGAMSDTTLLAGAVAIVLYYLAAETTGMYRSWRGISTERELVCALATWAGTLVVLLAIGHFTPYGSALQPMTVLIWLIVTPLAIASGRILVRAGLQSLRQRGYNSRGFAVVGVTELGFQLARNIEASPEQGLKLVGFYEDRAPERLPDIPADLGTTQGNIDQLVAAAKDGTVNMVYITFPMRAEARIREVLNRLADSTASVYVVPDFFVFELLHSRWTNIQGLPVVSVFENPLYGIDGLAKRVLDLVGATLGLLLLALPMALVALLIKLTSPGPVFFRQKRYGLDGREILVWKFRSMTVCENSDNVQQATKNDARVTPLGRILRKTSIDELPQLFNVLEGTMSLVGPRPHATAHNETYRKMIDGYMLRHKVKPGITGLAQVCGWRGETDTIEKMQGRINCDHQYIREWSLWMDIKILFRTVLVVFSQKNAY